MKYCLFRKHAALCYDRPLPGDLPSVSATVSGRCIMDRVSFEGDDPGLSLIDLRFFQKCVTNYFEIYEMCDISI